ncbi:MAG: TMEM175 family protein, partial [Candidatus Dormibacteraceae bacterium]
MPEDDETERAIRAPGAEAAQPGAAPSRPGAAQEVDEYGVGRLLALSDGVFGVAMTLIVLDIAVPAVEGVVTNQQAIQALLEKVSSLAIFGFSFGIVGIYWINHHRALRRLRTVSTWGLRRNLAMLLLICLVPFSTAFFERFNGTTTGDRVYLG